MNYRRNFICSHYEFKMPFTLAFIVKVPCAVAFQQFSKDFQFSWREHPICACLFFIQITF